MLNIVFNGQENLLVLLSAFIIGGVFKSRNLFLPIFTAITNKIHSKRFCLFIISLVAGILPIEGRVSVSAPILDSLMRKVANSQDEDLEKKRSKMGILDYVATHHYYLWSPLEKSIILMMAGLSLTYLQVLQYTAIPLILYLCYLAYIVFVYVKEDDIDLAARTDTPWSKYAFMNVVPFIVGIGWSMVYPPYYVFPIVALFYILRNKVHIKEILSYINWRALFTVALIIVIANVVKDNQTGIVRALNSYLSVSSDAPSVSLLVYSIAIGGISAFILGSSSKYAGIAVAITLLLGIRFFPIILMIEYSAYLLSPMHKCLAISVSYFRTSVFEFYKRIGILALIMVCVGMVLTVMA